MTHATLTFSALAQGLVSADAADRGYFRVTFPTSKITATGQRYWRRPGRYKVDPDTGLVSIPNVRPVDELDPTLSRRIKIEVFTSGRRKASPVAVFYVEPTTDDINDNVIDGDALIPYIAPDGGSPPSGGGGSGNFVPFGSAPSPAGSYAIGDWAEATGNDSVAVYGYASGDEAVALAGDGQDDNTTAVGFLAWSTEPGATAIGHYATAAGDRSVALGIDAEALLDDVAVVTGRALSVVPHFAAGTQESMLILRSPDGTEWALRIDNDGTPSVSPPWGAT